jgi:hypothetical protein
MNRNRKSIHLYPTLRCNGTCSYCSNISPNNAKIYQYEERPPGHWIKLIRTLIDWDVYFTGGEIFLFQGITDILESIPDFARIYTNGMLINERLIGKTNPQRVLFRCSYHSCIGAVEVFLNNMAILKKLEIPFQIFMVDVPSDDAVGHKINTFRPLSYEIGIDYDQRRHIHKNGKVRCSIPTVFVGPDGTVFHCVSRLMRNKHGGPNLFDVGMVLDPEPEMVICDEPGACTPCDLAAAYQESL